MQKTVAVCSLGCKVNQYESAAVAELFRKRGYREVDFSDRADVYVINTCTVTHLGDRKSRQLIRRAARTNPGAVVVVTGCYAQTSPGEVLAMPEVDLVVGTGERAKIVDLVEEIDPAGEAINAVFDIEEIKLFEELPAPEGQGRVRAFLKIQEGCRNFCAYCIIPYARGPLRSRYPEAVLAEAGELISRGFKEIVLTGIHTGAYGVDLGGKINLAEMMERLLRLKGLKRLRLSSIEPIDVTPELIDLMAMEPVICNHLHIPLQSGSDRILKLMRRRYRAKDYARLLQELRSKIPGIAITTDVMVGFPGETDEDFARGYQFIKDMSFAGLHVFKYSPRKGTPAADFPEQVEAKTKDKRSHLLIELGDRMALGYAQSFAGRTVDVLVEQAFPGRQGFYEGLTDNYLRVVFPGQEGLRGELVKIKLDKPGIQYQEGILI